MTWKKGAIGLLTILLSAGFFSCVNLETAGKGRADLVLTNGRIYTVDEDQPVVDTAVIKDGVFVYVGNGDDPAARKWLSGAREVIDLSGRAVIPGMIDGHTHPTAVALSAWKVILPWSDDVEEILTFVKEYCAEHPVEEVPYFFGMYYPSDMFGTTGPTKELLDSYVSDRPVRLQDFSDHCCWLNSRALELMGVDKNTPDPQPGLSYFVRDAQGNPTGWVKENATADFEGNMFEAIGWYPPEDMTPELMLPLLEFWRSKGVIGLLDAVIESESVLETMYALDREGELNMYYEGCSLLTEFSELDNAIASAKEWQEKYGTDHIRINTIKYFLDGTNEIGTSAVIEPFSNDPTGTNHGSLNMSREDLTAVMVRLNEENLDFHVHLVGDLAFRTICDAVEDARAACGDAWNIDVELAHCELVDPADMKRPAELGIQINWSPHWTGGYFGDVAKEWLGEERFNRMYDFTTMIASGALVNYGSDVVSMEEFTRSDPFFGIQIAHTRIDPDYTMDTIVRAPASACLPLEDLLEGYTLNAAIELNIEDLTGTIETGKRANLSVLSDDLFRVPEDHIMSISPTLVLFEGRVIYGQY